MTDVVRIELPNLYGMGTVNSYLVRGSENVLIDCGEDTNESYAALVKGLHQEGLKLHDIDRIYITHAHVDHIGMAERVSTEAQCDVWVSDLVKPWAIDTVTNWNIRAEVMIDTMGHFLAPEWAEGMLSMFREMSNKMLTQWHSIKSDKIKVFNHKDDKILIGDSHWTVLYAPGHSTTQSCFYNEETKELFSADMLLKITPTPVIEASTAKGAMRQKSIITMIESYEYYKKLPISRVYPGHYEEFDDPIEKINTQLSRIHNRKLECYELIQEGVDNLMGIFQTLYKGRWHLPAFNMTLAYVDLLEYEGKIEIKESANDITRIVPKS